MLPHDFLICSNLEVTQEHTQRGAWIRGPGWDICFVFSGLWVVGLMAFAELFVSGAVKLAAVILAVGNLVFWAGHNLSPIMMAWSDGPLRNHMLKRRWLFIGFPLALMVLAISLELIRGGPVRWSYLFFFVYLAWNSWHFGSQHFGILTLYRRRVRPTDDRTRFWDSLYCRGLFCFVLPLAWFSQGLFLGPLFQVLPRPEALPGAKWAVVSLCLLSVLLMIFRELWQNARSFQRIFYLVLVAIQPLLAATVHPLIHFALYTSTHYLLVMAMASTLFSSQKKNVFCLPQKWRLPGFPSGNAVVHFVSLIVWSPLFYFLIYGQRPRFGMEAFHRAALQWGDAVPFLSWLLAPRGISAESAAVLTGLYYGLALTHFFYDRFVYKFQKNPALLSALMRSS